VATKGGLTRPDGRWVADGRASALAMACEASLKALGTDRIQLYQLHAPDPRTPLETSVRALHALRRQGLVESVGLCNVTVGQIDTARRITEVAAVQVELSLWHDASVLSGVLDYCAAQRIALYAYRPLGGTGRGSRVFADPVLAAIASERQVTAFEVALASLAALPGTVVPLPGPTRADTARSAARAARLALSDAELARLGERFPVFRSHWLPPPVAAARRQPSGAEVVIVMGLPAAGKSTIARQLVAEGYLRINRDESGGTLRQLLPRLDGALASGARRIVLDNTYVSRASRAAVIQAAAEHGASVRCLWLTTSVDDAQINAASRLIARYGHLPMPDEMRAARRDPAVFAPGVQFRYQRELEPPELGEGFSRVDAVSFERMRPAASTNRALVLWCDGVLCRSAAGARVPLSPDDVAVFPDRASVVRRYADEGYRLLGLSWRPEIAAGTLTPSAADAIFERLCVHLGVPVEIAYCPHAAGPPVCWCRKPLPGLGVAFVNRHALDPSQCIYVGASAQDRLFAERLGFEYREAGTFFGSSPTKRR
jgi:diketogulonate reductase-like aldo/keto reductase/predicted kinase/histidinol phosphatase-like enzyme